MKKVLLNLINTDIKKYISFKINFIYFFIVLLLNCDSDSSLSPTWYTTINFPLTSEEILFNDIISECSYTTEESCLLDDSNQCAWNGIDCINQVFSLSVSDNEQDSLITLNFGGDIIEPGVLGLNDSLLNFEVTFPSFSPNLNIQENFDFSSFDNMGFNANPINIDFNDIINSLGIGSNQCIPKTYIEEQISAFSFDTTFSISMDLINGYFSDYSYSTISEFLISENIQNSAPFDINFSISLSGLDTIYSSNNTVGEIVDVNQIYNEEHDIDSTITFNISSSLPIQNYCSSTIPVDYNQAECIFDWVDSYCVNNLGSIDFNINSQEECFNAGNVWLQNSPYCLNILSGLIENVDEGTCNNNPIFQWVSQTATAVCYEENGFQFLDGEDYNLLFSFGMTNIEIKSVTGALNITTNPINESVDLPSFGNDNLSFELRGAKITDESLENINQLSLSYINNSPIDIDLQIILDNFEKNGLVLTDYFTIPSGEQNGSHVVDLSSCLFLNENDVGIDDIDEIDTLQIENIKYSINILPLEPKEYLLSDLETIQISVPSVQVDTLKFEYLNAAVEEMPIQTPSVEFDDIPSGFGGLVFSNPVMEINISNEIGIGSTIEMHLLGINENQEEQEMIINGLVYPSDNPNEVQNSCIRVYDDCVASYKGECGTLSCQDCLFSENCTSNQSDISLPEFLQHAPVVLSVSDSSKAILSGTGFLYPNTFVWGEFSLIAPFSFIVGDTLNGEFSNLDIMPSDPTQINSIEGSTRDLIDNSLIEASIISSVSNDSPIIGSASIMVSSDQDFFPLHIDEYTDFLKSCTISENYNQMNECTEFGTSFNNLIFEVVDTLLVDKINFSLLNNDSQIKIIEFVNSTGLQDSILLSYGRLTDFILPGPIFVEGECDLILDTLSSSPYEVNAETGYYESVMDSLQLKLINQSAINKYVNTIISLQNSNDLNNNDCQDESSNGVIHIYNDDKINIQSYISFIVNPVGSF